ncbi:tyrosine-type recombinase/integrase [Waddlia chondrophila]|uniref:Tyr recombinase domain-containing protein n=1 Tax=Waddlia chondrophila (strain ATCC VR-1470 / WSU 86-1044) TaxID=716544 RepID=D6YV81_WADCW|nr:tyrosine-type recombinase/integrase [Waddlia chondrophila]ADI38042.1 hypothetical protein wcw_0674 [Waddlia chondrophila WSU 86-1044]
MTNKTLESETAHKLWAQQVTANQEKQKLIDGLCHSSIEDAVGFWWLYFKKSSASATIQNYRNYLKDLVRRHILHVSNEKGRPYSIIELPEQYPTICKDLDLDESLNINEKRYRLNALIAFTKFLEEITESKVVPLIPPISFGFNLTNEQEPPLVLNDQNLRQLLHEIKECSLRDYLIVRLVSYFARSLHQILKLKTNNINFTSSLIQFSDGEDTNLPLSKDLVEDLKKYIEATKDQRKDLTLFITRAGKPVYRTHFQHILDQASEKIQLGFRATITMLQWSEVAKSLTHHQRNIKEVLDEFKIRNIPKFLEEELGIKRK